MWETNGLTLLDAVVGLAIGIFLMAALGIFVLFQNRKLGAETQMVAAEQEMRAAFELISGDLREAGRRAAGASYTAEPSPPGLCDRAPDRVRLTLDRDGDGTTTGAGEDVTYCLCRGAASATIYRAYRPTAGAAFVVEPVADDVADLRFTYGPRSVISRLDVTVTSPLGTTWRGGRVETFLRNHPRPVSCAAAAACPPAVCP